MHFANQIEVLAYITFLLGFGKSGHPHLLGILSHFRHCFLSMGYSRIVEYCITFIWVMQPVSKETF